mgnify:CR=1 FL=1
MENNGLKIRYKLKGGSDCSLDDAIIETLEKFGFKHTGGHGGLESGLDFEKEEEKELPKEEILKLLNHWYYFYDY